MIGRFFRIRQSRKFEDFRRCFLNRTVLCLNAQDLEKNLPRYDAVIVGSDQVWSPDVDRRKKTDPIYFFRWNLPLGVRKIAYAASFGTGKILRPHVEPVRDGLANIDIVSVREATGVQIVKELSGRDAKWVCDPVFLLTGKEWRKLASAPGCRNNDLMVYMAPSKDILRSVARMLRTMIIAPGWNIQYLLTWRLRISLPSPLQWISRISASRGVITKSFHGTAFCILMHTPFVYIRPTGAAGHRATRVIDLLERLNLSARMVAECEATPTQIATLLCTKIDWQSVEANLELYREDSKEFVRTALG